MGFLYALQREVLRNARHCSGLAVTRRFLYALQREVLRNVEDWADGEVLRLTGFYTPFSVRCFGTPLRYSSIGARSVSIRPSA